MSFLKLGEDLREQVSIFIENVRRIEGVEKIINLTAEKFLSVSKDSKFEYKLAQFFSNNVQELSKSPSKFNFKTNIFFHK